MIHLTIDDQAIEVTEGRTLLEACREGMTLIGQRFESGDYFLSDLIMAGEIFKTAAAALTTQGGAKSPGKGIVVLGTVKGDIHDIGKDIVATMLDINGYEVKDLGVDVPVEGFVAAAREFRPQVVALSGFLTLAYDPMRATIAALRAETSLGEVKFMIGGGQMDENVRVYTGADAFGLDAVAAVKLCDGWLG